MEETIVAIATPHGMGGVGVVRISGNQSLVIAKKIWKSANHDKQKNIKSRFMYFGWIFDGNKKIDQSLLVYMQSPNSYTGEDVVELHTHGSELVLDSLLDLAIKYGARLAEPGEFTKRAYLNKKIDLAQAEAVNDIIHAKSQAALRAATDRLAGSMSKKVNEIKNKLITLSAAQTAFLDFADEDISPTSDQQLIAELNDVNKQIKNELNTQKRLDIFSGGVKIAIVGLPNAGKSTLLNKLLGYDRAIVTKHAGTTRDTLEENLLIEDIPVRLVDTAGLNQNAKSIEKIGIEKSKQSLKNADLILLLIEPKALQKTTKYLIDNKLEEVINKKNTILVLTKGDLKTTTKPKYKNIESLIVSAKTGEGVTNLNKLIAHKTKQLDFTTEQSSTATKRQATLLKLAKTNLDKAIELLNNNHTKDIVLVEIDEAINNLNQIVGEDVSSAKLTEMFSNFCIGK